MDFWEFNEHNLDDKGRLVLPASFRDAFEDGGILAFQGQCAVIHTPAGWENTIRKIEGSGDYSKRELAVIKSYVTHFKPDAQSRVKIPERLREATNLKSKVSLIGMGRYIALYPKDLWDQIQEETMRGPGGTSSLADRLSEEF